VFDGVKQGVLVGVGVGVAEHTNVYV